jgi:DNA-binding LacI/PurR family transcriptional regulator
VTERVTLQTIADALGVSRTTVSNAYNRPTQLNPELRAKVLEKARELGYAGPDPAARRLRSGRRDAIGMLFCDTLSQAFTDPAAMLFLQSIVQVTEPAGLPLLLLAGPQPGGADDVVATIREAVVDSFVVYSLPHGHPQVQAAIERRLPIVVVDEPRLPGASYIGIDDYGGARAAAEHLTGLGHRRFGIVSMRMKDDDHPEGRLDPERLASATYTVSRARADGYRAGVEAAGIDPASVPIEERHGGSSASGAEAARALLAETPRPTAILASSDRLALGVLAVARELGIAVPGELSVVGFDDIPDAAFAVPALTTVRQPLEEKGSAAARLVLERPETPREIKLPVELVVRASTGPAPG